MNSFLLKKINPWSLALFIILTMSCNCFYLIKGDFLPVSCTDIVIILNLFLFVVVFLTDYRYCCRNFARIFVFAEFGFVILSLISSVSAFLNWSQPLALGIRAQRAYFTYPLILQTYIWLFDRGRIDRDDIIRTLYSFAFVEMLLGLMQVAFGSGYVFLHVQSTSSASRFGTTIRLYMTNSVISFVFCHSFSKLSLRKRIFLHLLTIFICFLFFCFVSQSRMRIVSVIATGLFAVLASKNLRRKTKAISIFLCVILLGILFRTDIGKDILALVSGNSSQDTSIIRDFGREFYLDSFISNPLFPGGYVNVEWERSVIGSMYNRAVYANDNGIFGFVYYYGIIGLLFILILYSIFLKKGICVLKQSKDTTILCYLFYSIVGLVSLYGLGMNADLMLPLSILYIYMEDSDGALLAKGSCSFELQRFG